MTLEIAFVFIVALVAVILFATEKLPVDLVALLCMAALLVSGVITPEEGLRGFSNTATVTVAAMFIVSAALFKTGAVNAIGTGFAGLWKRSVTAGLIALMVTVGLASAFMNNTAVVAILLPIVVKVGCDAGVSPSKLLMPLSFAAMFGGVCTLIGTTTNIVVSSIAETHGQPAFAMFEFAPLGLVLFAVGTVYMAVVGVRLIPSRRPAKDLTEAFGMGTYLTEITLLPGAASVGKRLVDAPLVQDLDIDILGIERDGARLNLPGPETVLQAHDVLRVRCSKGALRNVQDREGVALRPDSMGREGESAAKDTLLVEVIVAPHSLLEEHSLKDVGFRGRFGGATVLAMRQRGRMLREKLNEVQLHGGDVLLIEVNRRTLERLKASDAFVLVSELPGKVPTGWRTVAALAIFVGVVVAATLGLRPIVVSAIVGCVLVVLTRCITLGEAYNAIDWQVIFLLAGSLTLGVSLEKTGAARLASEGLISVVGAWGPVAVLSALYLVTTILTEAMSNVATAALVAPIAVVTATSLGIGPRPFLVAVAVAASTSFLTPVGYQTNTMIYGPGQYRFTDFARVGGPLNLLFWLIATMLIPVIWPFGPP